MASYYGPTAPIGANDGDVWTNQTTGETRTWASGGWQARMGYGAGSGGTATQITNRSTGVTVNALYGQITTDTTSLAAGAEASFVVTNALVKATDVVVVCAKSGQTAGTSVPIVTAVADGSFTITLTNLHASTADTGAMVINFAVVRSAAT